MVPRRSRRRRHARDLVFELHALTLWPEHPYGFSILGTPESVGSLTARNLTAVHKRGTIGELRDRGRGHVTWSAATVLEREGWFEVTRKPGAAP